MMSALDTDAHNQVLALLGLKPYKRSDAMRISNRLEKGLPKRCIGRLMRQTDLT